MTTNSRFTIITPLPASIRREIVLSFLHAHEDMIDLNPLVEERHPIKPPPNATAEEYHCIWYSLTDRVQYLPGGLMSGKVSYNACFHDLQNGLQTHVYAPLGLNIKGKWTLGGSLPGEPIAPVELGVGAPLQGLWLREDVDMSCNFMMTSFVKKTLKKAHAHLVSRLMVKAQIMGASEANLALSEERESHSSSGQFSRGTRQYEPSYTSYASSMHSRSSSSDDWNQNIQFNSRPRPRAPASAARDGGRDPNYVAQGLRGHTNTDRSNNSRSSSPAPSNTGSLNARKPNSYRSSSAEPPARALWQTLSSPKRSLEGGIDPTHYHAQPETQQLNTPAMPQQPKYNPATYHPQQYGAVELEAPLR